MWKSTPFPHTDSSCDLSEESDFKAHDSKQTMSSDHEVGGTSSEDYSQRSELNLNPQTTLPRAHPLNQLPKLPRRKGGYTPGNKTAKESSQLPPFPASGIENQPPLANLKPNYDLPKQQYLATEKFPDFSPVDFAFSVANHCNDPRSRANTTHSLYKHNPKSRSATDAELAVQIMSDEAIAQTHTTLLTSPPPPSSIHEVRAHRSSLKDTRRRLISDVIRPRTISRAQSIVRKEQQEFKSEREWLGSREVALDVLGQLAAKDVLGPSRRSEEDGEATGEIDCEEDRNDRR